MMAGALDDIIAMRMDESPITGPLLFCTMRERMVKMPYGILEVIAQHHIEYGTPFDFHTAFVMAMCAHWYLDGDLAVFEIHVGDVPTRDAEWRENLRRLQSISAKHAVRVWRPSTICSDGELELSADEIHFYGVGMRKPQSRVLPLEIGTTAASTTWMNLSQCRGVARWPYNHDHITVLCFRDDFRSMAPMPKCKKQRRKKQRRT